MADTPNPVIRRARILLAAQLGYDAAGDVAGLLDEAQLLARPADRIPAPHPVFVRRTGLGAELGLDSLFAALLGGLATEFAEDPAGVGEELAAIAAASGPERDALLETLLDRLGGATVGLGATAARTLADRLNSAAGPALPHQQNRRAA
jgi:hypothetical protein